MQEKLPKTNKRLITGAVSEDTTQEDKKRMVLDNTIGYKHPTRQDKWSKSNDKNNIIKIKILLLVFLI